MLNPLKVLALVSFSLLCGCNRTKAGSTDREKILSDSVADAEAQRTHRDASIATTATPSAFALVVDGSVFDFRRLASGPLVAIESYVTPYLLLEDGAVSAIEPLVEAWSRIEEGKRFGQVSGEWPGGLYVEGVWGSERSGTHFDMELVTDAAVVVMKKTNGHLRNVSPWSGGRLLGFRAEGTSGLSHDLFGWGGAFEVVKGEKVAELPRFPPNATFDGPFAAYESGRIFALGGTHPKRAADEAGWAYGYVWDFADGIHPKGTRLPEIPEDDRPQLDIARGRNEREALIFGQIRMSQTEVEPYLARFDGTSWARVPVPLEESVRSLSIGDDGSVWAVSGHESEGIATGSVWRADLPTLHFEKVLLPLIPAGPLVKENTTAVAPLAVAAKSAADVWITAHRMGSAATIDRVLLHNRPAKTALRLPAKEDLERTVLNKKPAEKYTPSCACPFLLLGPASELGEKDVTSLLASIKFPFDATVGRVHTTRVYGVEFSPSSLADTPYKTPSALLAAVRAKRPSADLVCTRPVVEKTVKP